MSKPRTFDILPPAPRRAAGPQFHEGQDVEVLILDLDERTHIRRGGTYRKATIVRKSPEHINCYYVQFRYGTIAVFCADHIRSVSP